MDIAYNNLNFLLTNSIKPTYPILGNIEISLENYIKSQVHFPLLGYIVDGRCIDDYLQAYKYIRYESDDDSDEEAFYRVARYFYLDIASSIRKASYKPEMFDFKITLGNVPNVPVLVVNNSLFEQSNNLKLWENKLNFIDKKMKEQTLEFIEMG